MNNILSSKAALYIRVSTHWQIDKDSLQVQERELRAYCQLVLNIADCVVFTDPGFSAKNTDRPAYQDMMRRLRSGEFSHLIVWKIDRISRNLLDFASMYSELKSLGVTFISKNEQFDTSTAIGEAMLKIILVFAELERNMTSERVSSVMLSRANNGQWNGGRVPYGYSWNKSKNEFSIVPEEADVVRRIYKLGKERNTIYRITSILNQEGFRTRSGGNWSTIAVSKILKNPFYYGSYVYNIRNGRNGPKRPESEWTVSDNHHVGIIEQSEFDAVRYVIEKNTKVPSSRISSSRVHALSGIVKCGICGCGMTASRSSSRADGTSRTIYGCSARRKKTSECSNEYVTEDIIVSFLLSFMSNLLIAQKRYSPALSQKSLQSILLDGPTLSIVKSIQQKSLKSIISVISNKSTGIEFSPEISSSDSPPAEQNKEHLESQRKRQELALNRLKSLYLYGDSSLPEKDYIVERERIISTISEIDSKLEDIAKRESENKYSEDYAKKASYVILADILAKNDLDDMQRISKVLDSEILRQFFSVTLSEVHVVRGKVQKIVMKSGLHVQFEY